MAWVRHTEIAARFQAERAMYWLNEKLNTSPGYGGS